MTEAVAGALTALALGSMATAFGLVTVAVLGPVTVAVPSASALPAVASSNEADKNVENRHWWLVLGI